MLTMVRRHATSAAKAKQVLDAAEALLLEHGYEATSLDMISSRSGISKGSIAHFLTTKPAVVRGVHRRIRDRVMAPITEAIRAAGEGALAETIARIVEVTAIVLEAEAKSVELIEALESSSSDFVPRKDRLARRLADALQAEPRLARSSDGADRTAAALYAVVFGPIFAELRLTTTKLRPGPKESSVNHLIAVALAGLDPASREPEVPARALKKGEGGARPRGQSVSKAQGDPRPADAPEQRAFRL